MTTALQKIDACTVRATVDLGVAELKDAVAKAEDHLGQQVVIEGFRKGKVPGDIVRGHLKPEHIREEALQIAVAESLQKLVEQEQFDILDQSDFKIKENSTEKLIYTVVLSLYPTVILGTYMGVSVVKKTPTTTEEELDRVLGDIAASRKVADKVPELTDEFAKSLGQFTSLQNLRDMIRTGLQQEKEDREQNRIRLELLQTIVKNSNVPAPSRMVELQLDSMFSNFDAELHARGMELGPYLAHIKKTQDDLRKEWHPKAMEQVRMQLVMREIAKKEHLTADAEEVKEQLEMLFQQDQTIDLERARQAIISSLLNKKVFEFLESHAIMNS